MLRLLLGVDGGDDDIADDTAVVAAVASISAKEHVVGLVDGNGASIVDDATADATAEAIADVPPGLSHGKRACNICSSSSLPW